MEKPDMTWRKSSRSSSNGGACIEVASITRSVAIRDTKQEHMGDARTVLNVTSGAWQTFTASLK